MSRLHRCRVQLVWAAILVAALVWLVMPLDWQPSWPVVLAIVLCAAVSCCVALHGTPKANPDAMSLEGATMHQPVVIVIGPQAGALFAGGAPARRDGGAIWRQVPGTEELERVMEESRTECGRWPAAALLPVIPDEIDDDAAMRRELARWRHALDETARYRASALPCHVAIYAHLGGTGTDAPAWYGSAADMTGKLAAVQSVRHGMLAVRQQLDASSNGESDIKRAALAHALFNWMENAAFPSAVDRVANAAHLTLRHVLLADLGGVAVRASTWTRWLVARTGLQPAVAPRTLPLPLPPLSLARLTVSDGGEMSSQPLWLHAVIAVAAALAIMFAVSGWSNGRHVARVAADLRAWYARESVNDTTERALIESLRQHLAAARRYEHGATPATLGWGLYRGDAFEAELERAMSVVRLTAPSMVLDSLPLFDSGKVTLKAGAAQQLEGAIELIRANPGKRILIAGHTDDVGSHDTNLKLSEARAKAIRDWFVARSAVPVTRFAIQGYGATRPLESNADERGRAMNRRVEITLLPDESHR
ncbi:OmpA family protein [Burkholderia sp. JSH-S8]|nr:OmpA family protein [Burkholderia sp. JSH-S8]